MEHRRVPLVESITGSTGRKLDFAIIGVFALGVAVLLADRFRPRPAPAGAQSAPAAAAVSASTPNADRSRFLAVLPFTNLSGSADTDPFAAGIHDDLLTRLSRIASLKVTILDGRKLRRLSTVLRHQSAPRR